MSLDVYLTVKKYYSYDGGKTFIPEDEQVYWSNITHNLTEMASKANIYEALWRPENIGATKAGEIATILSKGLEDLKARPDYFKKFNPSNGWGSYESLVSFVEQYLHACMTYVRAEITVSR